MNRRFSVLALLLLLLGSALQGCGGDPTQPVTTAPGTDTRTEQEKESESMLEKSQKEYNKKFGK